MPGSGYSGKSGSEFEVFGVESELDCDGGLDGE